MTQYNRHTFYRNTFCVFTEVESSACTGNPDFISKSGSQYFFTQDGVFRVSNHWGRAAKCKWRLLPMENSSNRLKTGYAEWNRFHRDNDSESLYIIIADATLGSVSYVHKDIGDSKGLCRTASETTKRIREIRHILKDRKWLMHFPEHQRREIFEKVVYELIDTATPLAKIRSNIARQIMEQP